MREFKLGDRVRIYGNICHGSKWVSSTWCGTKGTVVALLSGYAPPGGMTVRIMDPRGPDSKTLDVVISPGQCRLLKPKVEPRRVFIKLHPDSLPGENSCVFHSSVAGPAYVVEQKSRGALTKWIEFVEVRRDKR